MEFVWGLMLGLVLGGSLVGWFNKGDALVEVEKEIADQAVGKAKDLVNK